MAEITVKYIENQPEWETFIATHSEANFLQSWLWGEFHIQLNHIVHRSGFYKGTQLIGVMLSIVEPARRAHYLTVPGGPIINWYDELLVEATIKEMERISKTENCVFARVRPQLVQDEFSKNLFRRKGFRPAAMHLHAELTSQLDISKDEEIIRQNFRKNTRYELKQAKKRGVIISHSADAAIIDQFYELQLATARRHNFIPYGKTFLCEQFKLFAQAGQALLYSAHTKDGRLIAQAFVIFYNQEAAYHYGASTELGRSEPGAYLIQWEAIKEAKRRGMTRYNFWGVVKPNQTKHRFFGVSIFKRGFRGEDVEYLHAQDLVINWLRYVPNLIIETYRKHARHL